MADSIFADGPLDAPESYIVPGSAEIIPLSVAALVDGTNASGDFVPVLIFRDQQGNVISRVPTSTTVTAGESAEVSWFPHVGAGAKPPTGAIAARSSLYQSRGGVQAVTSGVLTAVTFTTFTSTPGWSPGLFGHPVTVQNPITFAAFGTAMFTLIVDFAAANYDRYIEMTIANPDVPQAGRSPRVRSQVSPDGDRLVLSAVLEGGPSAPATTVTANVFQASGVNQNVTATWIATEFQSHITLI